MVSVIVQKMSFERAIKSDLNGEEWWWSGRKAPHPNLKIKKKKNIKQKQNNEDEIDWMRIIKKNKKKFFFGFFDQKKKFTERNRYFLNENPKDAISFAIWKIWSQERSSFDLDDDDDADRIIDDDIAYILINEETNRH